MNRFEIELEVAHLERLTQGASANCHFLGIFVDDFRSGVSMFAQKKVYYSYTGDMACKVLASKSQFTILCVPLPFTIC